MSKTQNSNKSTRIHFRSLKVQDDEGASRYFLPALQVIAHSIAPLRKALIHFYFLSKSKTLERIEWRTLQAFGQVCQALIAPSSNDEESSTDAPPVDPTQFYKELVVCLKTFESNLQPKDATEALQILMTTIQRCCRALPITSQLWSALLDAAGLGLILKQSIVGRCILEEDGQILQRTKKESIMMWCPWVLPKPRNTPASKISIDRAIQECCAKQSFDYDFDQSPYDFEVRIPLLTRTISDEKDTSNWVTTIALNFSSLTTYLFLAIPRLDEDSGALKTPEEWKIPKRLDVSKLCVKELFKEKVGNTKYELIGGILHDGEEDYVAVVRNPSVEDPEDDDAWKLMESEEIIGMAESDVFDFLQGEGEGDPCGTVLVYQRCGEEPHQEMNQLLSDIVLSQISGKLEYSGTNAEFYYEEEMIDD